MPNRLPFIALIILLISNLKSIAQPTMGLNSFYTTTTTPLASNTACSPSKSVTLNGWLFSVNSTSNCGFNWTNSTGGDGRVQYLVGFGTATQLSFGSDDGSEFALNNLVWGVSTSSWTSKAMTFVGYKNGSAVPGATLNATTPSGTGILNTLVITFTNNSAFNDVDNILLSPNSTTCNSILFFEEITVSTASSTCPNPTFNIVSNNSVSCNGGSNGTASFSLTGGSGFTYTWVPSGGNASFATGLSAGIYTLFSTNSCGTMGTKTVQIAQPSSALITTSAVTNVICNGGSTGSGTITASGGTSPYSYLWGAGQTTSVISSQLAGFKTCTVTDANGCTSTKALTISEPGSALGTNTAISNILCFGGNTGSATVTASGGSSPYSYLWSTGSTSSVITAQIVGVKTVTVTDANGCTKTTSVTITQPTALTATTASINVLCFGGATGSATVSASGGASGYTYLWSSAQTTSVISSLVAGVRQVTVTDANNCTTSATVTITQPSSAVSSTIAAGPVSCNGGSNASATVTASGGTGPYSYLWSTSSTSSLVTGLNAGVKSVTITDNNSCSTSSNYTVTQPTAISISTAVLNVACYGASTGAGTVIASGGTPSYSYLWSSGATTSVITGQPSGVRTVTITDANNCLATKTISIDQPASAVTATINKTNVLCFGGNNGSATVTAAGGTGAYTYLWSGSQTNSIITSQTSGILQVIITDANSCTVAATSTITQPASALSISTQTNAVSCNGGSNGTSTVIANGGSTPYTYSWSTGATTSVITGQTAGTKSITITDNNGCISSTIAIINQPTALASSTTVINVLCNGGNNGSATVTASGGVAPYSYLWSSGSTNSIASSQTSGVKTVTITDANNCTRTESVQISAPNALIASLSTQSVLCFNGSTGSATVTGSGGVAPYTYLWSTSSTSSVITSQVSGVKTVTITDANGCSAAQSATLNQPTAALSATINTSPVLCYGNATGTATVVSAGGTNPYFYYWNTGSTTSVITGQSAGVKTTTITDNNNCTFTAQATLTQPAASVAISIASQSVLCFGNATGSATVTAGGGTGSYSYLWSTSATNSIVTGLVSGINSVSVTDANGCTVQGTVSIAQPASAVSQSTLSQLSVLCRGNNSGSISIAGSGGTAPYNYLWSNASTTASLTGLSAGLLTATVTDNNGCVKISTYTITQPTSSVAASANSNSVSCSNGSNGTATVTATGGVAPYTYLWSSASTSSIISSLSVGLQSYTVTDANGCNISGTVNILQPTAVSVTATAASNSVCIGLPVVLSANGTGGTGTITYSWTGGPASANYTTTINNTNTYTATATDGNGCSQSTSILITALVNPTIVVSSGTICAGRSYTVNPTGASTYTITGGSFIVSPVSTSIYTISGTSSQGCISNSQASVGVVTNPTVSAASTTVCLGNTVTLSASGASTYTWSNSVNTATNAVSPGSTASYTVIGTTNACTSIPVIANVTVIALPTVVVSNGTICNTANYTITPTGAQSYTYSSGSAVVSPSITSVYTVTGTSSVGCISGPSTLTVTVNPRPIVALNSGSICSGQSYTLLPSGASSYTLSSAYVVSPLITTNYSVVGTSSTGCLSTNTAVATVSVYFNPLVTGSSVSYCQGGIATLSVTGASTYSWNGVAGASTKTVLVNGNTTYTVIGASTVGCVSAPYSLYVTSTPGPTITVNSPSICLNQNATLIASGVNTYTWSTSAIVNSIIVSPATNTTYIVSGQLNGCNNTATAIANVSVATLPTIAISGNTNICSGYSTMLTFNGATSYTLSNGNVGTTALLTPTSTSNYTVIGTGAGGCIGSALQTVSVTPTTTLSISGTFSLCEGGSTTLTANGAGSYTWNNGSNLNSIVVSPTVNTSYSVTSTQFACIEPAIRQVTVFGNPTLSIGSSSALCNGATITMTASGANTYTWVNGPTSSNYTITPGSSSIYTVIGSFTTGCQSSQTTQIVVHPNPTISINGTSIICIGETTTLTANGVNSYTWSNSATFPFIVVTPTTTSSYSVFGIDLNGCSGSALSIVTVNVLPTLTINGNNPICAGNTTSLTVSGANTYTWQNGSNSNQVQITPTLSSGYSSFHVSGTSFDGCVNSKVDSVFVNAIPQMTITGASFLCTGNNLTLSVSGAASYTWESGATTPSIVLSPLTSGSFSVVGQSTAGCLGQSQANFTVVTTPTVSISGNLTVCKDESTTLTANGANTYSWSTGSTASVIVITPSVSTGYTLVGLVSQGCGDTTSVNLTVNPLPTLTLVATQPSICLGESMTLTATGATSYTWNTGQVNAPLVITPTASATYSVSGTNTFNCVNSSSINIEVNSCLSIKDVSPPSVRIFPNPSSGLFTIEGYSRLIRINIYDYSGKLLLESTYTTPSQIDLGGYPKGLYLLELKIEDKEMIYTKLIIE